MLNKTRLLMGLITSAALLPFASFAADDDSSRHYYYGHDRQYEVTITNVSSTTFTPLLAVAHKPAISLFESGAPASDELALLAEGGATGPFTDLLATVPELAADFETSGGLLGPGESTTLILNAPRQFRRISVAAMLLPTNDSFVGLNSVWTPSRIGQSYSYTAIGYDAGSEPNDELCANIPGPQCGGEGPSPTAGGEGFVKVSPGIHGEADLLASEYDWRNPVARVTIKRVRAQ